MTLTPHSLPAADHGAAPSWPSHLTTPSAGGWSYWRDCVLRGAGFGADLVRSLADPALCAAADALAGARAERDAALDAARASVDAEIAAMVAAVHAGSAPDRSDNGWPAALKDLRRGAALLRQGRADATLAALLPQELYQRLLAAVARADQSEAAYPAQYAAAGAALSARIGALCADPLLREAVAWQNHSVLQQAFDPLMAGGAMQGAKRKQREALVANYVQRYCTKNDTIGFFGPVAWCHIAGAARPGSYAPGAGLLRARSVRFEDWAIATYAETLAADARLLPVLVPRLQASVRLDGRQLVLTGGARADLSAADAQLLAGCDGVRSAQALANRLLANPLSVFASQDQVFDALRQLERAQRIHLTFQIPVCCAVPEVALRQHLQRAEDGAAKSAALAGLDSLEQARARVAGAAGDAAALQAAMQELDACFTGLTGAGTRRRQGETYGGRALVYEDCTRDLDVVIPEAALAPMQDAMDLVLASARWYVCQVAERYTARFATLLAQLGADANGTERVSLADFWLAAQAVLFGDDVPLADLSLALRERWESIVQPYADPGTRAVSLSVEQVRDKVAAAFPGGPAGWALARYQCPDVMFCAQGPEALLRGDYLCVLGEVHVGGNTLAKNGFASQHSDPSAIVRALASDMGTPYLMPRLSSESSGAPIRTQGLDDPAACLEIVYSQNAVPGNPATALRMAELYVSAESGQLMVHSVDGKHCLSLMDALGDFLFLAAANQFGVVRKRRRTPRITLGRLVIQREAWQFSLAELAGLVQADEAAAFLAVRRWKAAHELPGAVFIKVLWENKPFFIDLDSPLYVRLLVKHLRNAAEAGRSPDELVSLTEMLPSFDQLWVRDQAGRSYTSELRLVAIHRDDVPCA